MYGAWKSQKLVGNQTDFEHPISVSVGCLVYWIIDDYTNVLVGIIYDSVVATILALK